MAEAPQAHGVGQVGPSAAVAEDCLNQPAMAGDDGVCAGVLLSQPALDVAVVVGGRAARV